MPEKELVVVKFGSELVANGGVNQASIDTYARGLARIHAERNLIVVTSGAVAIGRTMLGDDAEMASCSAVGMPPAHECLAAGLLECRQISWPGARDTQRADRYCR